MNKEFQEILANIQLIYGSVARQDLQEAYAEDPEWALMIGRAALDPRAVAEKHRIDASERKIKVAQMSG
jgi:hypothetical protein